MVQRKIHHGMMAAVFTAMGILPVIEAAHAEPNAYNDRLSGGWGGARSAMSDQGFDWDITYKIDYIVKLNGNRERGNTFWLDNLDVVVSFDGEKSGVKGFSSMFHVLSNRGQKPAIESDRLPHGLDNIETPRGGNTTKIYQAWIQQSFGESGISVLAGLYDLNSEFYATKSSALFIHPTFGIGAELAGTGQNGPSIFPTTSLGLRLKYESTGGAYAQAVLLDGVPGDPDNQHGTHIQFSKGDGTFFVSEIGCLTESGKESSGKFAFGAWRYTAKFDDLLDVDAAGNPIRRNSYGVYVLGEHTLWQAGEKRLRGFLRVGRTEGDTTQFEQALGAGLLWEGFIPGRPGDQLGLAYAQETNSIKYRLSSGISVDRERSLELAYRSKITPWLAIQLFAQYLLNHGSDPAENKTWWLGMRFQLDV
ncbi:carbohydrate porin [Sulfurirhabdus autotrophica]|uniref:carbohydrate porin n=1 Tax=Sulfurirhabdus autotrophica TaxID=1706046 RepID=UPI000F60FFED|nr:carbohydrate porin [Sulfurirhabdus autotrophica]